MKGRAISPRTVVEAAVALFFFGCIAAAVKFVSANAITIGIARLGITIALLLPFLLFTKRLQKVSAADIRTLALMGTCFALHWLAFFFSIKVGSASVATVGLATYGVHLMVLRWIVQRSKITAIDMIVLMLAVAGSIMVIPALRVESRDATGLGLGILSGFFYALLPILQQQNTHLPALTRALGQFVFALIVFLFLWPLSDWTLTTTDWLGLIFLGVMCTLVSHTLWVKITTTLPTKTTSVIYYLFVPVSLILSVTILHEQVDGLMISGAGLIIAANILAVSHHSKVGESQH